jgi:hypothetical protein
MMMGGWRQSGVGLRGKLPGNAGRNRPRSLIPVTHSRLGISEAPSSQYQQLRFRTTTTAHLDFAATAINIWTIAYPRSGLSALRGLQLPLRKAQNPVARSLRSSSHYTTSISRASKPTMGLSPEEWPAAKVHQTFLDFFVKKNGHTFGAFGCNWWRILS